MVVDASAVLAVLFREPDAIRLRRHIALEGGSLISPINYWEVMVRAHSVAGDAGQREAEALLSELLVEIGETTPAQARLAVEAHRRFGRGTPAKLNLGDCFAYALAATEGDGLLFKGDDFTRTDVKAALP